MTNTQAELSIKPFPTPAAFHKWLTTHHAQSPGLWIRFYKKASHKKSITYAEALDIALCHGWIDGQLKPFDALSWLRKFTPRRPTSNWSKINTQHVARLIASGHMTPAGLAHITAAQADGRWTAAYDSQSNTAPPPDFLQLLAQNQKALAFYHTLTQANRYAITYRLQTAKKPETRARRLKLILDMLTNGKKFHP